MPGAWQADSGLCSKHSDYYPRFGFSTELAKKKLRGPYSGNAWMALEVILGALEGIVVTVPFTRYNDIALGPLSKHEFPIRAKILHIRPFVVPSFTLSSVTTKHECALGPKFNIRINLKC